MPEVAEAPVQTQPVTNAPVVEHGKTPLGQVYKERMAAREAADAAKATATNPDAKASEVVVKTNEPKVVDPKPDAKKEEKATAKVSPFDAIVEGAKPVDTKEKDAESIPDNAPAKQLREAYERQRSEVAKLKSELEARSKPDPAISGELETLRKERDDWKTEKEKLTKAITALDVRFSPEHQEKFVDGLKTAVSKAADKLKAYGGDADVLKDALSMPQGKSRSTAVKDAIADLDEIDRAKVLREIDRVEALEEERDSVLQDPQQAWAQMTKAQQDAANRKAEETERLKGAEFDKMAKALPETFLFARTVPDSVEGAADHNAKVASNFERARHLLSDKATYQEVQEAATKAAFADWMQEEYLAERSLRIAAEKEAQSMRGSEPGVRGAGQPPTNDKLNKSPGQLYREGMARRQGTV